MKQLTGKNIFIVEDDLINRITYQIMFTQEGAYVHFERRGPGTLDYLKSSLKSDLIILDLMLLQGEDGFHLFEEIRKLPGFAHIPIIAVSASDPLEAMERCRNLGFNGYISKPISDRLFPQQIAQILDGEAVWSIS